MTSTVQAPVNCMKCGWRIGTVTARAVLNQDYKLVPVFTLKEISAMKSHCPRCEATLREIAAVEVAAREEKIWLTQQR